MAIDQVVEKEAPEVKVIGRGDYSENGLMYGYRFHEKPEGFLDYYFSLATVKAFVDGLKRKGGRQVLDFGSGIGRESDRFKKLLPKSYIVSLDISDEGTKHGRQEYGLNQVQADINMPPFDNNEFDGIHCKDVLVHIKDKEEFIKNVSRMLKKGGLFLVSSSSIAWEGFKQFGWNPDELVIMAEDAGMELVKQESFQAPRDDWYLDEDSSVKEMMLFRKK